MDAPSLQPWTQRSHRLNTIYLLCWWGVDLDRGAGLFCALRYLINPPGIPRGKYRRAQNSLSRRINWGEPERAPHEREGWCQDVSYAAYAYGLVSRARCGVRVVTFTWAHVHTCGIWLRTRTYTALARARASG